MANSIYSESRRQLFADAALTGSQEPEKQLKAFVESLLLPSTDDNGESRIREEIAALGLAESGMSAERVKERELSIEEISGLIIGIYASRGEALDPQTGRMLALTVSSVIDGIRLESALNPASMAPGDARRIALDMIGARLSVSLS